MAWGNESVAVARLGSMCVAIDIGKTLADAKASGLVRTAEDERAWRCLEEEIKAMHAQGLHVHTGSLESISGD